MLTVKQYCTLLNRPFLRKTKNSTHPNNVALIRPGKEGKSGYQPSGWNGFEKIPPNHRSNNCPRSNWEPQMLCGVRRQTTSRWLIREAASTAYKMHALSAKVRNFRVHQKLYVNLGSLSSTDACPHCGVNPHIIRHLFECASRQTDLTHSHCGLTQWKRPYSWN